MAAEWGGGDVSQEVKFPGKRGSLWVMVAIVAFGAEPCHSPAYILKGSWLPATFRINQGEPRQNRQD